MFLAPSRSNLGESLLITTFLRIPLGEPDGKTPIAWEKDFFRMADCEIASVKAGDSSDES